MPQKTQPGDPLTKKQQDILNFIRWYIEEHSWGPSVRDTMDKFKLKSPNGVVEHFNALEKKGRIEREPGLARCIRVCDTKTRLLTDEEAEIIDSRRAKK